MENSTRQVPRYFTTLAILFYILTLIVAAMFFGKTFIDWLWIGFGMVEVVTFFYFSTQVSKRWSFLPEQSYRRRLFWNAFLVRAVYVVFSYFFLILMTGQPFEFGVGDAMFYDEAGAMVSDKILSGDFNFFKDTGVVLSDQGFPIFLGIVYTFVFKSLILSRLVISLFGAWSCLLVYDLAKRNFGEATGRISGIMMMLVPNLIYYCGLHLKEIIMTFLFIAFINLGDKILRNARLTIGQATLLILVASSLFLFRTVLGICAICAMALAIIMIPSRTAIIERRLIASIVLFFGIVYILGTGTKGEVDFLLQNRKLNQKSTLEESATIEGGNKYAVYGSNIIFSLLIIPAPFPSFVDTNQENTAMINGNIYTRNAYSFFVFLALIIMIKRKLYRRYILILSTLGSYLLVLSLSGFALSERFHVPAIPFLLILAAYGITESKAKHQKYFIRYMIVMMILILGWNWFKLAGRGIGI
jgi:hypothetical protein